MIPYIEWTHVQIGPLTLHVWGFFVGLGILLGVVVARWFAKSRNLNDQAVIDSATWGIVGGLIGARLGYVFFYNPQPFLENPFQLIALWDGGMSMVGGLIGAILAILLYLRRHRLPTFPYLDALAFGLPAGYACGRVGCFLIHDHPGTATDFVLGVRYPDGVTRHDHGLYLAIFGLVVAILFFFLRKYKIPHGAWVGVFFLLYGAVRFWLDFYRVADTTYFGLTPAQYISLFFIAGAIMILATRQWRVK